MELEPALRGARALSFLSVGHQKSHSGLGAFAAFRCMPRPSPSFHSTSPRAGKGLQRATQSTRTRKEIPPKEIPREFEKFAIFRSVRLDPLGLPPPLPAGGER